MNKQELREHLEQQAHRFTNIYGGEIHTHAESVDQQKRLHKKMETRRKPDNLRQQEWEQYLASLV